MSTDSIGPDIPREDSIHRFKSAVSHEFWDDAIKAALQLQDEEIWKRLILECQGDQETISKAVAELGNMEEAYKFVHHHLVYKRAKDKIFGYDVDWAFLLNLAKECGVDWLEYLELYNRSVDVGACDTAWESLRLYLEKCGENCMNDEDMQITYRRLYDRALSTFPTPPDFRVAFEVAERIFGEGLRLQKDVLDSISGDDVSFANTRLFFRLLFRYRGNGGSVLKYFLE